MLHTKSLGFLTAVGTVGLLAASCGGSNGAPTDGGLADITHMGMGAIVADGSGDDGGAVAYDGTLGTPCKTDADCKGVGGPGTNKCSNSPAVLVNLTNVEVTALPTPYCVVPPGPQGPNCDPAPASDPGGMQFHYCDGPDDPSSPGICVPYNQQAPVSGQGHCELGCTYTFDGSAPMGCPGQDTCSPIPGAVESDGTTGAILGGIGFCQGTCEKDADCRDLNAAQDAGAPWVCQLDIGYCTQHPLATRTKALGAACTFTGTRNDATTGACNCGIVDSGDNKAFCTSSCIVGGTVPCPMGWQCDNLEPPVLPDGVTPLTVENIDTQGVCLPACSLPPDGGIEASTPDAGDSTDASTDAEAGSAPVSPAEAGSASTCPPSATCQSQTVLGPECLP